jgi:predicted AAA+ superfamily ATPase
MFERLLALPRPGTETVFLWGPRQTGKSTLLRGRYGGGRWVDLLKADEFRRYVSRPELLRQELEAEEPRPGSQIVIDEIQKVPALPADQRRAKRRVIGSPKFYFVDVGAVNRLARRTDDGIEVLPAATFVRRLWDGDLL